MTLPCPIKMLAKIGQSSGSRLLVPVFVIVSTSSSLHSGSSANSCAVFPPGFVFLAPSVDCRDSDSMSKSFVLFASPVSAFSNSDFEILSLFCFKVLHAARRKVFAPFTWQVVQSKSHPEHGFFPAAVCFRVSAGSACFFRLLRFFAAILPPFPAHHSTAFAPVERKKEQPLPESLPQRSQKCCSLVSFSTPANPR